MECRRTAGLRPPSGDTAAKGLTRADSCPPPPPCDLPQARVEWVPILIARVRVAAASAGCLTWSPRQDPNGAAAASPTTAAPRREPPAQAATGQGPDEPTPQPCKRRSPGASGAPPNGGAHTPNTTSTDAGGADLICVGMHLNDPYAERRTTFSNAEPRPASSNPR